MDFNFFYIYSLEVLYLNDNQLTRVEKPRTNEMFAKLRFLRIEFNKIDNWDSLNALNNYPSLTKLRCKENPIFAGESLLFFLFFLVYLYVFV